MRLKLIVPLIVTIGIGGVFYFAVLRRQMRVRSADMSVGSYQIASAAEQFFLENPDRIFASYDDLIGPDRALRSSPISTQGEDYHELFPLRRDSEALGVTAADGHRVIVILTPNREFGRNSIFLRQSPDGSLAEVSEGLAGAGLALYRHWLGQENRTDGLQVKKLPGGRRFEITYQSGMPDGVFRAYYADGKLWAEATYRQGRPVGSHRIYDETGGVIYETTFESDGRTSQASAH